MKKCIIGIILFVAVVVGLALSNPPEVSARIKLATLPAREKVAIQLDNPNATLIEEERIVPLLKSTAERGNNQIDFSWRSTKIDKFSVQMRIVGIRKGGEFAPPKEIEEDGEKFPEVSVVTTSYPPDENALVWEVYANESCAAKIRVSYIVWGLGANYSYRALSTPDESTLELKQYMTVACDLGESYDEAEIWAGFGEPVTKELQDKSQLKILVKKFPAVKVEKVYRFDWASYGALSSDKPFASRIRMYYKLKNNKENGLGLFALPEGKIRVFINDGNEGEAFLGEDRIFGVPIDDDIEFSLGDARDIVCTRTVDSYERKTRDAKNLYDVDMVLKYEIQNFKTSACKLNIRESVRSALIQNGESPNGVCEWKLGKKTSDSVKVVYEKRRAKPTLIVDLPAASKDPKAEIEKIVVYFHIQAKNLWK